MGRVYCSIVWAGTSGCDEGSALEGMVGLEVHRDNVYTLLMNHRCVRY